MSTPETLKTCRFCGTLPNSSSPENCKTRDQTAECTWNYSPHTRHLLPKTAAARGLRDMGDTYTIDRSLVRQIIIKATRGGAHFWLGEELLAEIDKLPILTDPVSPT